MAIFVQSPSGEVVYSFDWSGWLPTGVSIATRQWSIYPAGPALANDTTAQVKVSGMTAGKIYRLTETVTLDDSEAQVVARSVTGRCEKGQ